MAYYIVYNRAADAAMVDRVVLKFFTGYHVFIIFIQSANV
jgi:hypothetical protein